MCCPPVSAARRRCGKPVKQLTIRFLLALLHWRASEPAGGFAATAGGGRRRDMARTTRSVVQKRQVRRTGWMRRMGRVRRPRAGWLLLVTLLAVLLAGCGSRATAAGGTPTATTIPLGTQPPQATATPGSTPPAPPTLPYSFPAAWTQASGLPSSVLWFGFAP